MSYGNDRYVNRGGTRFPFLYSLVSCSGLSKRRRHPGGLVQRIVGLIGRRAAIGRVPSASDRRDRSSRRYSSS